MTLTEFSDGKGPSRSLTSRTLLEANLLTIALKFGLVPQSGCGAYHLARQGDGGVT